MKKVIILFWIFLSASAAHAQQKVTYVFVGTYTNEKPDQGIYVYSLDEKTGELKKSGNAENVVNPSFLTLSPDGRFLYACTDTRQAIPGSITSFAIDSVHGMVTRISKQSGMGANPVYVTTDKQGRFVVNGNYTEGNVSVCTVNSEGFLSPSVQTLQFKDSSINRTRQEKSHIHSTIFSPGFDYLYLPDLGGDQIHVLKFDAGNQQPLTEVDSLTVHTIPGSGPRHMVFHPDQQRAYCIEEMGGMVSVYAYNRGKLTPVQRIASNQKAAAEYSSADIHISPDGLFLYASNRVENTMSIFSIGSSGILKLVGYEPTYGDGPRNFAIDPSGKFLLVANQISNNLIVFRRDPTSGLLKRTGTEINVPNPSCVKIRAYSR